jgi:hypothetical protein
MFGFGKKLISVIFVTSLLAGNASAAEPKLSGNYVLLMPITPPSGAITILLIYKVKITPNKTGRAGKILVVQSDEERADGLGLLPNGAILNYRTETGKLFISGFSCRGGGGDPNSMVGWEHLSFQETSSDCGSEKNFDISYADVSSNKIARYAFFDGVLETRKVNGLNSFPGSGLPAIPSQTLNTILLGTLVRQ